MGNYLFATPSFLSGAARTLDLGGVFDEYNDSSTPELADARAMHCDWLAAGIALEAALADAARECPNAVE